MNTPIFDQLVAEYAQRGIRFGEVVVKPVVNPPVITNKPSTPFKPAGCDKDTLQMPRVIPLSKVNRAA